MNASCFIDGVWRTPRAGREPAARGQPRPREDEQQAGHGPRAGALAQDGDADGDRDHRGDVGDDRGAARPHLGHEGAEEHEGHGRAEQPEHREGEQASPEGIADGGRAAARGVRARAAIASEAPIVARGSRSRSRRLSHMGPAA
jgi:hypothetical protein